MKEKLKVLSVMLMLLSVSLGLVSCSDDDDNDNGALVGTWDYKSASAGEVKTNSSANDEIIKAETIFEGNESFYGFWYDFKTGGGFSSSFKDETPGVGTYTYRKGILTIKAKNGTDVESMRLIVVSDNEFIIEHDYADEFNEMDSDRLVRLGIKDPNFKVSKAIARATFTKR